MAKPYLALSPTDQDLLLQDVQLICHCAATVKFNAPFSDALAMNVWGTARLCALAKNMRSLEVFLHVSTAYVHCDKGAGERIEERVLPLTHPMHTLLVAQCQHCAAVEFDRTAEGSDVVKDEVARLQGVLEGLDEATSSAFLLSGKPNTYTATKAMSEQGKTPTSGLQP